MLAKPYKEIGHRLAEARKRKGFSSALEAASAYGWPKSTYAAHENGSRKPKPDSMARYARRFGVSRFWLEFGREEPAQSSGAIRMAGLIGAGQKVLPDPDFSGEAALALDGIAAEAFEVRGDSMLPVAREGDMLFFGRPRTPANLIGRECIVETSSGERYFKTLAHGSRKGVFTLISYNAEPIPDVEIVAAGELLAIRRR